MIFRPALLALGATICLAAPAHADNFSFDGSTTGAPTFNRLFADLSGLSPFGANVSYSAYQFTVSAAGVHDFLSTANFDNFTFLYEGAFDAAQPQLGALIGNDDVSRLVSGFSYNLSAGTTYTYVTTGFDNGDAGAFTNTVTAAAVPEMATIAYLAAGFCALALARRRRSA
jgi:hypothetical protein